MASNVGSSEASSSKSNDLAEVMKLPQPDDEDNISIETHLEDVVAAQEASVVLQVKVYSRKPCGCIWLRNGLSINRTAPRHHARFETAAPWHRLYLFKLTIADVGLYSVVVTNESSYAVSQCHLYLNTERKLGTQAPRGALYIGWPHYPIKIVKPLKNKRLLEGFTITLKVEIEKPDFCEPTFEWYINNRLLESSSDYVQAVRGNSASLTLPRTAATHSGVYTVVVSYRHIALSSSADVLITKPLGKNNKCPSIIQHFSEEIIAYEKEEIQLFSKVYVDALTIIKLFKNGVSLVLPENMTFEENGKFVKLRIFNAIESDSGLYTLVLRDPSTDRICSTQCNVIIKKRPKKGVYSFVPVLRHLKFTITSNGAKAVLIATFKIPKDNMYFIEWTVGRWKIVKSTSKFNLIRNGNSTLLLIRQVESDMLGPVACSLRCLLPAEKSSIEVAVTRGMLVHVPPQPMKEISLSGESCLRVDRVFVDAQPGPSSSYWFQGTDEVSRLQPIEYGDLDEEPVATALPVMASSSRMATSCESSSTLNSSIYSSHSENMLEFLFCMFDTDELNFLMVEKCIRPECELSVERVQQKNTRYGNTDTSLLIQWKSRDELPGEECYRIELCWGDNEFSTCGISTAPKLVIEDARPNTILKVRVHLIEPPEEQCEATLHLATPVSPAPETQISNSEDKGKDPRSLHEFWEKYEQVGEALASGAFGTVYLAKKGQEFFAVKSIKTRTEKRRAAVKREISLMLLFKHERIVSIVDYMYTSRETLIVMEYLSGGELLERIFEEEHFEECSAIFHLRQICEGLQYLHDQSLVHLDMKPENVMCVDRNSRDIKIVDFGLCRYLDNEVRAIYGTREYIAPEVLAFEKITPYADMWSLGVLTYVMLSGLNPFAGEGWPELSANITRGEYSFADECFDNVSERAKDFINCLLVKEPEERLSAADALKHPWLTDGPECELGVGQSKLWRSHLRTYLEVNKARWQRAGNFVIAANRLMVGAHKESN